jgi:hypothetical protein
MHHKIRAAAVGCALALTACAGLPARQAAAPTADRRLEAQAQAFEAFMRRTRAISPAFAGPADVSDALAAGAAYEPVALENGMIAYAALAALQEPGFVAGVRASARGRGGSDLARRLAERPDLAANLPGAAAAVARASAALDRQADALGADGRRVKAASYGIQHQGWARAKVADPRGRLERVKQISKAGYRPEGEDRAQLYQAVARGPARGGVATPVVQRGVALAALSVLGDRDRGAGLSTEPKSAMCLRLAKLNFHQCLASAGPYYEDIYCLGQHAMIDPGKCVAEAAAR